LLQSFRFWPQNKRKAFKPRSNKKIVVVAKKLFADFVRAADKLLLEDMKELQVPVLSKQAVTYLPSPIP
jgi:hypothetical protein